MKCMRYVSYILIVLLSISTVHAEIKIGTTHYFPPFVINKYEGFDIDLMNYICQRIKTKCTLIQMKDKELFQALQDRKIDLVMSGITISPQLAKNYLFSLPYLRSRAVFIVPQQSTLKKIADLNGKTIGATNDLNEALYIDYLQTNFQNQFTVKIYDSTATLINALENGSLAAAFVHESSANYWKNNGLATIRILGNPRNIGDGIAFVALPDKQDLIDKINKELQWIEKNGIYLNFYKTYFGNDN